jgi:ubiquinone/menaquinone biosynthesis C-methylase UbiE
MSAHNLDLTNTYHVRYIDELPLWSAPFGMAILDAIEYRKSLKALDIGSGLGFPSTEIAMRLGKSSTVYALDPWEGAQKVLEEKLKIYGIENLKPVNGVAENIPFEAGYFDLITSNNGINNVQDLNKTFDEIRRVIKQGGQFIFTMNLDGTMREFYDALMVILDKRGLQPVIKEVEEHISHKRPSMEKMEVLLMQSGFRYKKTVSKFVMKFSDAMDIREHFLIKIGFMDSWRELLPEHEADSILYDTFFLMNINGVEDGVKLSVPWVVYSCQWQQPAAAGQWQQ